MKILSFSMLGMLICAGSAMAQYHPYSAPAALPVPAQGTAPSSYYDNPQPVPQQEYHAEGTHLHSHNEYITPGWDGGYDVGCSSCGSGCGSNWFSGFGNGCDACGPNWYGRVGGLVMTRDDADPIWTSFNNTVITSALLGTPSVGPDWQGGYEASIGRRLCSNVWVGATYWTLEPDNQSATVSDPGGIINSTFDFRTLALNGTPVNSWYDSALAHRLSLRSEFHNAELNFFGDFASNPCSRHRFSWFGGARWFRFKDDFLFETADTSTTFGVDLANEAYWNINVTNNLIGGQIGGTAEYALTNCWSVYATPSVGLYHNRMTYNSSIRSGDGFVAYNIDSDKNDFAVLSQIDFGSSYNVNQCVRAYFGYRLISAAGVALSGEQIPPLGDDLENIRNIDSDGHLFLHGGFAGIEFRR
ncbi:MAG: BBP7 family outer membrane beta-barrel protein [Pirellulales bacterium]|nr:BBP7 family outer membrane beta-barrel protein [Pirellulales bacterium]